jgi:hypothetical protein
VKETKENKKGRKRRKRRRLGSAEEAPDKDVPGEPESSTQDPTPHPRYFCPTI